MAPRRIFVEVHGEAGRVTRQLMELWSGSEVLRATDVAQKIAGSADRVHLRAASLLTRRVDASVGREVVEVSVEGFAVSSESCGSVFRDGDRVTIRLGRALSPLRAQESTRAAPSPSRRLPKASGERKAKVSTLEALTHLKEASSKSPAERRKRKKRCVATLCWRGPSSLAAFFWRSLLRTTYHLYLQRAGGGVGAGS
eukprot:scaffold895_cov315-Pinguiococcus_pyrenoidosus.AAC.14